MGYLLVLIDMQEGEGPICLAGQAGNDLLFYRIPQSAAMSSSMEERSRGYWQGIAFATRFWAHGAGLVSVVQTLADVKALCEAFDGGNTASELFAPRRFSAQ